MSEQQQYNVVSKLIHWITALIIFGLLFLGYTMTAMDYSEDKFALYALHKSFGLLVLILLAIRLIWHIIKPKPKALKTHAIWEKSLAHAAHIFLYIALLMLPLSGWLMSSAGDFTVQFFGLDVPDIAQKDEALFKNSRLVHETFALAIIAVLCTHVAGALKHHFIDKDATLKRMTTHKIGFIGGVFITALIAIALFGIGNAYISKTKPMKTPTQSAQISTQQETLSINNITEWTIQPDNSTLSFTATQYGQDFSGTFGFSGQIFFDPANLQNSQVSITINISTIKTGSEDRDAQAKSDEWFDISTFPMATFKADKFEQTAQGYIARGELKIRDITQEINLPFTLDIKEENDQRHARMKSEITLMRLDFNVGQGQWESTDAIGNEVNIQIDLTAQATTP